MGELPKDLVAVQKMANLLDRAVTIPVINVQVGWDAVVGLVPGAGDVVGGVMSTSVLLAALRHRVPLRVVWRMAVNTLVDMGVGSVPVVGDVLDVVLKNNVRNVELLMQHRDGTQPPRELPAMVKAVVAGVVGTAAVGTAALAWLMVWGISVLWGMLGG
jgi:hypothetical protein